MRRRLSLLAATVCLSTSIYASNTEQPINRIAAIANGDIILESTVNKQIATLKENAEENHMPPMSMKDMHELVTNQLIMQTLQLQMARQHQIGTTHKQIDQAFDSIAKSHHMNTNQFKAKLKKDGYTVTSFKKELAKQLTIMALQHQVVNRTDTLVTQKDISNYRRNNHLKRATYQYQIGDILIKTPDTMTAEQVKNLTRRAEEIAKKIKAGANFNNLAKLESSASSPDATHTLPWSTKDELPTAFTHAFTSYHVGESRGPIRTANGWHIIKILARRENPGGVSDDQIRDMLFRQKYNKALDAWLKQLRQTSDVHILNNK